MTNEPELLYSIRDVKAYNVEDGQEQLLTTEGPQTLSLFMIPASSPPLAPAPIEEVQLKLKLSTNIDLILPANTHITFQAPNNYLIPHLDTTSKNNSSIRIEFPLEHERNGINEAVDTFESILAQCKIEIEDTSTPPPQYDPSTYKPGYDPSKFEKSGATNPNANRQSQGQIKIIDENSGDVIGELGSGFQVVEYAHFKPGSNGPVEITLPSQNSTQISVTPVSESYLDLATHPVYKNSALVSKAALASRFIVTTSSQVSKTLQSQADAFTKKTKPNSKPLKFEPATHARIRKACKLTEDAAGLSSVAVGQVQKYAQNIGASVTKRSKSRTKTTIGADGKPVENFKPGLINKSLVAISTIADGIDQASRSLLAGTSSAVTTVVDHKYGPEAGEISRNIGGGVRNCGLVYIDATGVTRRAILKSVVKGAVIGRLSDGSNLVVGESGVYGNGKESGEKSDIPASTPDIATYQDEKKHWKEKEALQDTWNASNRIPHPNISSSNHQTFPAYRPGLSTSTSTGV